MKRTHELLYLDKLRSWTYLQFLFELFCLMMLVVMVTVQNIGVYVETNAEPVCVEFYNFVQCYIFINYLTSSQVM
jgi:hypothetical protein